MRRRESAGFGQIGRRGRERAAPACQPADDGRSIWQHAGPTWEGADHDSAAAGAVLPARSAAAGAAAELGTAGSALGPAAPAAAMGSAAAVGTAAGPPPATVAAAAGRPAAAARTGPRHA